MKRATVAHYLYLRGAVARFSAFLIAGSFALPLAGGAQSVGPELLGFIRTPTEDRAIVVEQGAEGRRNGPWTLAVGERRDKLELLALDLDQGTVWVNNGSEKAELRLVPTDKRSTNETKTAWVLRLQRFPAERVLMFYAMTRRVGMAHPSLDGVPPISLDVSAAEQDQFLTALDAALARQGIRVQHVDRKFALLSSSSKAAPQMHSWPIPLGPSAPKAFPPGSLQVLQMASEQLFDLYVQVCGYEGDRSGVGRPAQPVPCCASLLAGVKLSAVEAKHVFETLLEWDGLRAELSPDGKLRALWRNAGR